MSNTNNVKVIFKGKDTDLIVFAENSEILNNFKANPKLSELANVVPVFKIFTTQSGRGTEGAFGEASKSQVENELGKNLTTEEYLFKILKEGKYQQVENLEKNKFSSTNDSKY
ncbi:related to Restriction of telomere capping protein 3 [Saccharomycodes ludwigii]|uniref:Related to Restriction of telomere capping protein 3 n=1 Tax=Saccharomycodes ludwigii TaxID=36035 RepID=A0A376B5I6_9ASCO|nr:hypothetical protein SCDLUD_004886 [Saccharomycodes ludwigii]KAH3899443.1 hypothetical protein SCDLUD_004886 [Saccharomycodes ludwigii]SSD59390.1 related to Restriction of telomere capping protein 3 [Saccharomycodes ludwigii]